MRKLILHIGRHKTGTTAIQRFLYKNQSLLTANGFHYPRIGIRGFGHHELGAPITKGAISNSIQCAEKIIANIRSELDSELEDNDAVIVISSESFQNCAPGLVKKLFSDFDVEVVVYLREQVAYLLSAYAQKVQATDYTSGLEEFSKIYTKSSYLDFLEQWESEFPSAIRVKSYDREALLEGNVVIDFCHYFLGLDAKLVSSLCSSTNANPTLTRDLLEFKLWINRSEPLSAKMSKVVFRELANLVAEDDSGGQPISDELARFIEMRFKDSNTRIAKKYFGRDVLFPPFSQPDNRLSDEQLLDRMDRIRTKLITANPDLASNLPDISEYGTRQA